MQYIKCTKNENVNKNNNDVCYKEHKQLAQCIRQ